MQIAHADPRNDVFRIGAQHTSEHVGSLFVLAGFEHCFTEQTIDGDALGILLKDVLAVGRGLFVPPLFD